MKIKLTWFRNVFVFLGLVLAIFILTKDKTLDQNGSDKKILLATLAISGALIPILLTYLEVKADASDLEFRIGPIRARFERKKMGGNDRHMTNTASNTSGNPNIDEKIRKLIVQERDKFVEKILSEESEKHRNYNLLNKQIDSLQFGVKLQIERLSRSGNLNLLIGLAFSVSALLILGSLAFQLKDFGTKISSTDFMYTVIPRVSLAIFIELISFFFLRLYKRALDDIKYFQNERTNIDSKAISIRAALIAEDKDILKKAIDGYSKVERNFVLKKGESTVFIQSENAEQKFDIEIINKLTSLLHKANGESRN